MIRIGILDSESSHGASFARLTNLPQPDGGYLFPEARITALYGLDKAQADAMALDYGIEMVAASPDELFGRVDAVMVLFRNGSLHYKYALPFVERGIPVWVDKPFTIDPQEAMHLVQLAQSRGVPLAGGSNCKYAPDVLALHDDLARLAQKGVQLSGGLNFPGIPESPYGGLYFYAGHAAEIMTTVFGEAPLSLKAELYRGTMLATVKYREYAVTINFAQANDYYCTIYSKDEVICRRLDISGIFAEGMGRFIHMLRTGHMPESYHSLLRPVRLLNALEQAIKTGQEILL